MIIFHDALNAQAGDMHDVTTTRRVGGTSLAATALSREY